MADQRGGKPNKETPERKGPIVEHRTGGLNVRRKSSPAIEAGVAPQIEAAGPLPPATAAESVASLVPPAEPEAPASPRAFRSAKVEPKASPPPAAELPLPV